jgi:hypothetical protein
MIHENAINEWSETAPWVSKKNEAWEVVKRELVEKM